MAESTIRVLKPSESRACQPCARMKTKCDFTQRPCPACVHRKMESECLADAQVARRACAPCRRAKRNCDRARPCGRCIKLGKSELCESYVKGQFNASRNSGNSGDEQVVAENNVVITSSPKRDPSTHQHPEEQDVKPQVASTPAMAAAASIAAGKGTIMASSAPNTAAAALAPQPVYYLPQVNAGNTSGVTPMMPMQIPIGMVDPVTGMTSIIIGFPMAVNQLLNQQAALMNPQALASNPHIAMLASAAAAAAGMMPVQVGQFNPAIMQAVQHQMLAGGMNPAMLAHQQSMPIPANPVITTSSAEEMVVDQKPVILEEMNDEDAKVDQEHEEAEEDPAAPVSSNSVQHSPRSSRTQSPVRDVKQSPSTVSVEQPAA